MWPKLSYTSFSSSKKHVRETIKEGDETIEDASGYEQNFMRIQLALLDYKQFKAARTIQRYFRGFYVRNILKRQIAAAILIQRAWRQHIAKRHLIIMAQELVQTSVVLNYNLCSLMIQKLFRGWWSRKHVNNMLYLKQMKLNCMEDMLNAYAYKLHTLMRTGHLPGYMDFHHNFLQKLEPLLSTLSYRFYNRYVGNKYMTNKSIMLSQLREFKKSVYWTWVPFTGFDVNGECQRLPSWDKTPKVYDLREYDVAQVFMTENRITAVQKKIRLAKERKLRQKSKKLCDNEARFCKDLVKSMRYWDVCKECHLKVTDSFMKTDFESFVSEIKDQLEAVKYVLNCNCQRDTRNEVDIQPCKIIPQPII